MNWIKETPAERKAQAEAVIKRFKEQELKKQTK